MEGEPETHYLRSKDKGKFSKEKKTTEFLAITLDSTRRRIKFFK